jgi:hypothetical protein
LDSTELTAKNCEAGILQASATERRRRLAQLRGSSSGTPTYSSSANRFRCESGNLRSATRRYNSSGVLPPATITLRVSGCVSHATRQSAAAALASPAVGWIETFIRVSRSGARLRAGAGSQFAPTAIAPLSARTRAPSAGRALLQESAPVRRLAMISGRFGKRRIHNQSPTFSDRCQGMQADFERRFRAF